MTGWQPIATAPKDGTSILLVCDGRVLIGRWLDAAEYERFEHKPGWQIVDCEDGWYSWAEETATHWMPLPDPPAAEEPTPEESGLCCMARHANAVPPWTCDCPCHNPAAEKKP